jgi:uncharacterized membrane protein YtjA (UPF0391 family)
MRPSSPLWPVATRRVPGLDAGAARKFGTKAAWNGFRTDSKDENMSLLKWALIFLAISLVAALFGFTGISAASADIARILFYIFVVIFLVLLVLGLMAFRA